jgi:hypothetical protein
MELLTSLIMKNCAGQSRKFSITSSYLGMMAKLSPRITSTMSMGLSVAAFDIEVVIIRMLEIDDTFKFGIDYANHGTIRGTPV